MNAGVAFVLGIGVGVAAIALLAPSHDACCSMLAHAARDKIASTISSDPGTQSAISGILDATGATNALPTLLNIFGVEKN